MIGAAGHVRVHACVCACESACVCTCAYVCACVCVCVCVVYLNVYTSGDEVNYLFMPIYRPEMDAKYLLLLWHIAWGGRLAVIPDIFHGFW